MKICVGSLNPVKLDAAKEIFVSSEITGFKAKSMVSEQPESLNETITGAKNRAIESYNHIFKNDGETYLGVGIESGIIPSEYAKSGFFNTCASVIYNGQNFFIGLSSCFEHPKKIIDYVKEHNCDISKAYFETGITNDSRIGYGKGAIFLLTKGKIDRKEYTKQGLMIAKSSLENELN